jgi:hypothetical protein
MVGCSPSAIVGQVENGSKGWSQRALMDSKLLVLVVTPPPVECRFLSAGCERRDLFPISETRTWLD